MKHLIAALLLVPSLAFAQSAVRQSGSVNHNDVTKWDQTGIIKSGGGLQGDNTGQGVNPFAIQDNGALGLCFITAPGTTGSSLCVGHDGNGNPVFSINGSSYPFNPALVGNVSGPNPTTVGDFALWNNTTGTLLMDSGPNLTFTSNVLTVGVDANGGYLPHNPALPLTALVSAVGAKNAIIGQVDNNIPYNTTNYLPVGVTGYAKVPTGTQSYAFGIYGLGEIFNTSGGTTNEMTVRNQTGSPADSGIPPQTGNPTHLSVNGLQVTCGGLSDCSTGLLIGQEGGATTKWANGLIINNYENSGLFLFPPATNAKTTETNQNNGTGINLILQTTGTLNPAAAVLEVMDSGFVAHAVIRQNGDAVFNNLTIGSGGGIFAGSNEFLSASGSGAVTFGGDPSLTSIQLGNGTTLITLATTFTATTCTNNGFITIKDVGGTNRKVMICS